MCEQMGHDGENQKEHVDDDKHNKEYNRLYDLCYRLECKVNRVSKVVKWIGCLTVIIALISIALSIGNAVAGCGCKHAQDCKCISGCLSGWGIAALVLGVISGMLSLAVAILGVANDANKEQVFTINQSNPPTMSTPTTSSIKVISIRKRFKDRIRYWLPIIVNILTCLTIILTIILIRK